MPPPPATVVGRDAVIAEVRALVREPARLITLWGPGGMGKTTTALAAVAEIDHTFVALARATTEDEALRATADALGVELGSTRKPEAKLGAALGARAGHVLVLDNLEQMVDAGAGFVATLRAVAPTTTFLVTTREALTLRGETVVEIPPLDDDSAATLLRARSGANVLDDATARAIAARLEGLPLAIELAAARLDVVAPDDLLARLDDRLGVLRTTRRDVDPRHRALAQAIESSFQLLEPAAAEALLVLATFAGSFDAHDAEALLGSAPSPTLDVLEALHRKSLLARRRGARRFAILESIRAFCNERASSVVGARHGAWATERARELRRRLDGPEAGAAMSELVQRHDDLAAALARAQREQADPAAVATLLEGLVPLAVQRGPTASYVGLATDVLARSTEYPAEARGRILVAASQIVAADGDRRRSLELATEGARALEAAPEASPRDRAAAELRIGNSHFGLGAYDDARAAYARATTFARAAGDRALLGSAAASNAVTEHASGNVQIARTHYETAVRTFAEGSHVALEAKVLSNLAFLELDDGHVAVARERFERARAIFESVLDARHVAVTDGFLGNVLRAEGRPREAAAVYGAVVVRLRHVGDRLYGFVFTMDHGIALLLDGDGAGAIAPLREALGGAIELEDAHLAGFASGYLVAAHALAGDLAAARAAAVEARTHARGVAARALAVHELHLGDVTPEDARARLVADAAAGGGGEHVRIARLLAERALAERAPPADALVVEGGALRARLPGGTLLDLGAHGTPARVLDALVRGRLEHPGEPCAAEALVARVWPGERLARGSGENRLRVAIAKLRALGLKELIEGRGGGYLLRSETPVVRVKALPNHD